MLKTAVIGFPRVGENRELKKVTESYFKGNTTQQALLEKAKELRLKHLSVQKKAGIDFISSNDFSFYDHFLDMCFTLNIIPKRFKELSLNHLDTYFAMARGYQKNEKDVKALPMKKWFNTNYHYVVSELEGSTNIKLNSNKIFNEFSEALDEKIDTKPTLIGPFTILKLIKNSSNKEKSTFIGDFITVYREIFSKLGKLGASTIQLEEPYLVYDLDKEDIALFKQIYSKLLKEKYDLKVLLQTYFGDIRDIYKDVINLDFDAIGMDFIEGEKNLSLIKNSFPKNKILFAGIVNGKNIWKNSYKKSLEIIETISKETENIVINTSCSLLHVPYSVANENKMEDLYKEQLSFAVEKLYELEDIKKLSNLSRNNEVYLNNQNIINKKLNNKDFININLREKIENLQESDFNRDLDFKERAKIQRPLFNLPPLPTTTIGSFPQDAELRKIRRDYKHSNITKSEYNNYIKSKIDNLIKLQEDIGLDVLVHGEYERNDMVEYFGENLNGFIFSENGWVQSYGTRCVKPPIIFGDITRAKPITVEWTKYSQSKSNKLMKGMLTGPVTMLNWSFPREDLPLKNITYQIALAIRDEVLDLEKAGIKIIQIDEAALREKLPLKKEEWFDNYLSWAIDAFRLTASAVKNETQIHTHMCYSEFENIIESIDSMDADVITIEAAKSDLSLLNVLSDYEKEIGPGVYDIHSPRVPSIKELKDIITKIGDKISYDKLWINPDCGLKTRSEKEVKDSLINMVEAAKEIRNSL